MTGKRPSRQLRRYSHEIEHSRPSFIDPLPCDLMGGVEEAAYAPIDISNGNEISREVSLL